ncbi:hypothetical protein GCM10010211_82500 [Streptomyces albospinus]|uniref:Uncharacterized protein n=1 Tax=Streptomyces albospinus TaxID=285515 RepID=A0ABQ2VNQ7_9ACTN|nr:hypothetical protein GCM10010211_82500 [Streptomyces albospinus]
MPCDRAPELTGLSITVGHTSRIAAEGTLEPARLSTGPAAEVLEVDLLQFLGCDVAQVLLGGDLAVGIEDAHGFAMVRRRGRPSSVVPGGCIRTGHGCGRGCHRFLTSHSG